MELWVAGSPSDLFSEHLARASARKISILAAPVGREERRWRSLRATDVRASTSSWQKRGSKVRAAHSSHRRLRAANDPGVQDATLM